MKFLPILLLSSTIALATSDPSLKTKYSLYHRLSTFNLNDGPISTNLPTIEARWIPRGIIHVNATFDSAHFVQHQEIKELEGNGDLYQIGIGCGDGIKLILQDACILLHSSKIKMNETISITLNERNEFIGFNYFTATQPGCFDRPNEGLLKNLKGTGQVNIRITRPVMLDTVRLSELPKQVIGLDGNVQVPIPEKSFIQKYWMYLVPVVLVLVFTGGPEEEEPQKEKTS